MARNNEIVVRLKDSVLIPIKQESGRDVSENVKKYIFDISEDFDSASLKDVSSSLESISSNTTALIETVKEKGDTFRDMSKMAGSRNEIILDKMNSLKQYEASISRILKAIGNNKSKLDDLEEMGVEIKDLEMLESFTDNFDTLIDSVAVVMATQKHQERYLSGAVEYLSKVYNEFGDKRLNDDNLVELALTMGLETKYDSEDRGDMRNKRTHHSEKKEEAKARAAKYLDKLNCSIAQLTDREMDTYTDIINSWRDSDGDDDRLDDRKKKRDRDRDDDDRSGKKKSRFFDGDSLGSDDGSLGRKKKSRYDDDEYDDYKSKKKSRYDDDEYDDYKSKKKSRYDDDDYDDRPRKKKSKYDDYDEYDDYKSKKKSRYDDDYDDTSRKKKRGRDRDDDDRYVNTDDEVIICM